MQRILWNFCLGFLLFTTVPVFATRVDPAVDEARIVKAIKNLRSQGPAVRESAAKILRDIVAKYPTGTTNVRDKDGGKAYWASKIEHVEPGMTETQVHKILKPSTDFPERTTLGSGYSHTVTYRLDRDWMVSVSYRNADKLIGRPELIKREAAVYVEPPTAFTGTWTTWYVNGQKSHEIQFMRGLYEGVFLHFHDNGGRAFEQHYVANIANGTDTGWFPDGKLMYMAQYKYGKQDGKWSHWYENGKPSSEVNYRNGVHDGRYAGWYENGQMRFEINYKNGIKHGIEAAWNEAGVVQYRREYKDGEVVN